MSEAKNEISIRRRQIMKIALPRSTFAPTKNEIERGERITFSDQILRDQIELYSCKCKPRVSRLDYWRKNSSDRKAFLLAARQDPDVPLDWRHFPIVIEMTLTTCVSNPSEARDDEHDQISDFRL